MSKSTLTPQERAVVDLIDEDALIDLTCRLVDAGGANPGGTEEQVVSALATAAAERGLVSHADTVAPSRPNIDVELAPSGDDGRIGDGPGLLFLGHSDVVPAGSGWSREPFTASVDGGRIYGRGATDMKGGLAAVLVAMDALRRAEAHLRGPVRLACTVDEEDLGLGIRALVARGLGRDFLGCVVAEPTDLNTITACRGDAYIEVEVTGVPAHSGRPADGRSAIGAAARLIALIQEDHDRLLAGARGLLGSGTWNVGRIEGGRITSMVAPSCHLWIDRRLLPGEDAEQILQSLLAQADAAGITGDGISLEGRVTMAMPGFTTEEDHPLVRASHRAVQDVGAPSSVDVWTAACDGGFIAQAFGVPTVVMGPGGINDQAHQIDESVGVEELVAAARAYALLALRLLG